MLAALAAVLGWRPVAAGLGRALLLWCCSAVPPSGALGLLLGGTLRPDACCRSRTPCGSSCCWPAGSSRPGTGCRVRPRDGRAAALGGAGRGAADGADHGFRPARGARAGPPRLDGRGHRAGGPDRPPALILDDILRSARGPTRAPRPPCPVPPAVVRRLAVAAVTAEAGIAGHRVDRRVPVRAGPPDLAAVLPGSLVSTPHPEVAALRRVAGVQLPAAHVAVVAVTGRASSPRWGPADAVVLVRLALVEPLGVGRAGGDRWVQPAARARGRSVSVHFLASMALVWLAVALVAAATPSPGSPTSEAAGGQAAGLRLTTASNEGEGRRGPSCPGRARPDGDLTAVLGALLLAGTFVTAAGPYSATPTCCGWRSGFRPWPSCTRTCCSATSACSSGWASRCVPHRTGRPAAALRGAGGGGPSAGVLGGGQNALGLPEALASLHVLGAALATIAAAALSTGTARRGPAESPPTPPRPGAATPASRPGRAARRRWPSWTGWPSLNGAACAPRRWPPPAARTSSRPPTCPTCGLVGRLLVGVAVAGVNYIDTYHRRASTPSTCRSGSARKGRGGWGRLVTETWAVPRRHRVVWANIPDSYVDAWPCRPSGRREPRGHPRRRRRRRVPQGMVAHFLVSAPPRRPGDPPRHAAAGGVGLRLT